jgi:ribonuclease HI
MGYHLSKGRIALTRALTSAEGKTANIFTDSKYTYNIIHQHAALWEERGFSSQRAHPSPMGL